MGSLDWPFNPLSLALGAEATFVARSIDTDRKHLTEVLRTAAAHPGAAFVEIYQNCNVYNDGAFDAVREDKENVNRIPLEHGERDPLRRGGRARRRCSARRDAGDRRRWPTSARTHCSSTTRRSSIRASRSRCHGWRTRRPAPTPIGVFRDIERPVYDELMAGQLERAVEERGAGDLEALLHAGDTWVVSGGA